MFLSILVKLHIKPFDISDAESEIVSGLTTEYSGKLLGIIEITKQMMAFVLIALFADLFLSGSIIRSRRLGGFLSWCRIHLRHDRYGSFPVWTVQDRSGYLVDAPGATGPLSYCSILGSNLEVCTMKLSTKIRAFSGLASNLFHKPVTVRESFGFIAYLSRGLPRRDAIRCTGCGACNERCSSGATSITDHEGTRTVSIDSLRCIFCARCADICPEGALDLYFGTVHHDKDMSGAAGTIEHAATSDMSRQCLHDHDLDLSASVQYAKAISLSHRLEDKSVTVDTLLPLQKCRVLR